jgi:hypothetical protein
VDDAEGLAGQDIYKWVTHEKGILGSQGSYNKRHRQLCQPPFRSPALLASFADVIVQRYGTGPPRSPRPRFAERWADEIVCPVEQTASGREKERGDYAGRENERGLDGEGGSV